MRDYRHLKRMTGDFGILQFSTLDIPDPLSGYTLDDNARAFLVTLFMKEDGYQYAQKYIRYLNNAQGQDGTWSNFMYNNCFLSTYDSQDSIGRAILACSMGTLSHWPEIRMACTNMLKTSLPLVNKFSSPRAIAYVLIALCKGKIPGYRHRKLNAIINRLTGYLTGLYQEKRLAPWYWFEEYLTYCNGILPQAMFSVYIFNRDKEALRIGRESLSFLNDILFRAGYLNIIGNQGWYHREGQLTLFDQQPVDAASIALACLEAYQALGKDDYRHLAILAQKWYHGTNIHGIPLYNKATGGCYDALTSDGVNLNQGAEAVLSLLLTELALEQSLRIILPSEQLI